MQLADARVSERPLFSERDRWFETAFLQRRVRCEPEAGLVRRGCDRILACCAYSSARVCGCAGKRAPPGPIRPRLGAWKRQKVPLMAPSGKISRLSGPPNAKSSEPVRKSVALCAQR